MIVPRPPLTNRRNRPRPVTGRQASAASVYNIALLVILLLFAFALVIVR
jgi:hypothetical protein